MFDLLVTLLRLNVVFFGEVLIARRRCLKFCRRLSFHLLNIVESLLSVWLSVCWRQTWMSQQWRRRHFERKVRVDISFTETWALVVWFWLNQNTVLEDQRFPLDVQIKDHRLSRWYFGLFVRCCKISTFTAWKQRARYLSADLYSFTFKRRDLSTATFVFRNKRAADAAPQMRLLHATSFEQRARHLSTCTVNRLERTSAKPLMNCNKWEMLGNIWGKRRNNLFSTTLFSSDQYFNCFIVKEYIRI